MMIYDSTTAADPFPPSPAPSSPPSMTTSKSSKSSSFKSLGDDDNSVLADVSHFEEIGLDDDHLHPMHSDHQLKPSAVPFNPSLSPRLQAAPSLRNPSPSSTRLQHSRDFPARSHSLRDITSVSKSRLQPPKNQSPAGATSPAASRGFLPEPHKRPLPLRTLSTNRLAPQSLQRHRNPSPGLTLNPRSSSLVVAKPRRRSWQSSYERKSAVELELECDDEEDDGDFIPEGLVLDNVPISPRPAADRTGGQPPSKSPSPERSPKPRVRSVGNGTPPVAMAQGSLRSPTWKSDTAATDSKPASENGAPSPIKTRATSWNFALSELSAEAKALTAKLEEHADEMEKKLQRSSTGSMPTARKPSASDRYSDPKPRVKSALPELPPLRRTNIMIDPLPVSKEKEAVLSRTRPSWLPPKDPAEERRHLREYQKMMAHSAEAEKKRDAARRARSECRDTAADSLMRTWEDEILPRWNDAIRERRTRDLWWRGIAPRSRGRVWAKAIGNELGLTEASFAAALARAHEAEARVKAGNENTDDALHASWFSAIRKDAEESTWRDLRIFQAGAPLHQSLVDVLSAYAMYRSDIGYVTGCNTIAALLLLNLPTPAAAFVALANILNRSLPLSFYVDDAGAKGSAYNLLLQTLARKSPNLHKHLTGLPDHDVDAYMGRVFTSLFTDCLALDEATRLWDVYVFEGDSILVRAAVALLVENEMTLFGAKSLDEVGVVLGTVTAGPDGGEKKQRVVSGNGADNRWISAVREAGKA